MDILLIVIIMFLIFYLLGRALWHNKEFQETFLQQMADYERQREALAKWEHCQRYYECDWPELCKQGDCRKVRNRKQE